MAIEIRRIFTFSDKSAKTFNVTTTAAFSTEGDRSLRLVHESSSTTRTSSTLGGRAQARARTRVHFKYSLSQSKGTGNSGHREHFSRRRVGFRRPRPCRLASGSRTLARPKEVARTTSNYHTPHATRTMLGTWRDKTLFVGCDRCRDGDPRLCSTLPCSTCVELGGHGVYLESCFFYKSGVFTPKDVEVCLSGCFPDPLH